jgi:hypothetical protein
MSGFENYAAQTAQLEREIQRKGIALGIDWDDPLEVNALARAALEFRADQSVAAGDDRQLQTRHELFGLAQLMLHVMEESAREEIHSHGGPIWKIFGRALWREWQAQQESENSPNE